MVNEEYVRVVAYYLKNKNIANILKHKCATLAAGGGYERIYIYILIPYNTWAPCWDTENIFSV